MRVISPTSIDLSQRMSSGARVHLAATLSVRDPRTKTLAQETSLHRGLTDVIQERESSNMLIRCLKGLPTTM